MKLSEILMNNFWVNLGLVFVASITLILQIQDTVKVIRNKDIIRIIVFIIDDIILILLTIFYIYQVLRIANILG